MTRLRSRGIGVAPETRPLRSRLRLAAAMMAVAVAGATLSLGHSSRAGAQTAQKVPVRAKAGVGEFQPAADGDFVAWEQNTKARPKRFNVYAKPSGGAKFRVNTAGTQGALGGIDGPLLVYQQFRGGSSNIKFFNLETKKRSTPQIYINTRLWEYWPSISGPWVLFGRRTASGSERKVILYNRAKQTARILDRTQSSNAFIAPGQVNGNFAVWYRCKTLRKCNVYRYNISLKVSKKVPNPKDKDQHSPSVTAAGTVYFARGTKKCGTAAKLMRYESGSPPQALMRFKRGIDVGDTYASSDATGNTEVFFEQNRCRTTVGSDIFKIAG